MKSAAPVDATQARLSAASPRGRSATSVCRAVCLPNSAYGRSMTPDGPREIVIDHADLERVGDRVHEIQLGPALGDSNRILRASARNDRRSLEVPARASCARACSLATLTPPVTTRATPILDWDGPPWALNGIGLYVQEADGRW